MVYSQEVSPNHLGSIFFDRLFVNKGPVGIGYEHFFSINKLPTFSAKAGIGVNYENLPVALNSENVFPVHLGGSFLFGKEAYLEAGFLLLTDSHRGSFIPLFGLRYLDPEKILTLRLFFAIVPNIADKPNSVRHPIVGLSIGYLIN